VLCVLCCVFCAVCSVLCVLCCVLCAPCRVVSCHAAGSPHVPACADRIQQAKALVNYRLSVSPSPRLLCALGGLTDSDEPYERAWTLSNGR
jgi:hypothetical protein